jgi:hypothetical protein
MMSKNDPSGFRILLQKIDAYRDEQGDDVEKDWTVDRQELEEIRALREIVTQIACSENVYFSRIS